MDDTGIDFTNRVNDTKDFNIFSYRNFYNGGGCAIGDLNNDGLADVFFTANMGSNKLYINKGNWKFEDISAKAGIEETNKWSTGVVMVDINNDSLLDIYVCNAGYQKGMRQENSLFINNGDLTFREAAREYGLANDGYTTHAAFFDYDADGDLDCYILNNSFIPERTVTLVDIEIVVFMEIIADEDVGITIHIDITYNYTETITDDRAVDPRQFRHVCKSPVVIPEKPVAG